MSDSKLDPKKDYFEKYRETVIAEVRIEFWQAVKLGLGIGIGLMILSALAFTVSVILGMGLIYL